MRFRLADVDPDTPSVGGKARGLARARAAGLAIPDGFVLTDPSDDPAPAALEGPLVVRSSAEIEDAAEQAAPGIFLSRRDVAPDELPVAIAAVRASADGETARAYASARRLPLPFPMAVIVQRQVDGVSGTAYSRAPGGDDALIEVGDHAALVSPGGEVRGAVPGLDAKELGRIAAAARAGEAALGAPADVEWVLGDRLWVVQLRPAVRPPPPEMPAELARDLARLDASVTWTWDAEHNPEPLSPAQRGLVALVDDARAAPIRQRVVAGYLYTAPGGAAPSPVEPPEIPALFDRLEGVLAAMGSDLEAVLSSYLSFYRLYTIVLGPSLARLPQKAGALRRAHADLAPVWDVAAPTFGETPGLLERLDGADAPTPFRELDDVYFARAQAAVRRALQGQAQKLGVGEDDVFWLSLSDVRAGRVSDAGAHAADARAAHAALRAFVPPRSIVEGVPVFAFPPDADHLRGRGTGGRARGRVVKIDLRKPAPVSRGVAVVPTLTPALALLCRDAAALVAEHGGLLGHAAALARELGIPCVVGCLGAERLSPGEEVWVDADAGIVLRLRP